MLLNIIFNFSIHSPVGLTEKNLWGNDTCFLSRDCTGLSVCDPYLGCVISVGKVVGVVFAILTVSLLSFCIGVYICLRWSPKPRYVYPKKQCLKRSPVAIKPPNSHLLSGNKSNLPNRCQYQLITSASYGSVDSTC